MHPAHSHELGSALNEEASLALYDIKKLDKNQLIGKINTQINVTRPN